jgi:hypothetical protein
MIRGGYLPLGMTMIMMDKMSSFYLNSYAPLAASKAGREASVESHIPPFVDGSIRREPDLEHEFPAISCLCRTDKFAPRLAVGDSVAYMLRKGKYGTGRAQRRLTALLRVIAIRPSHTEGSKWYIERGLSLPNNCMVHGNAAKPFEHSHRIVRTSYTLDASQSYKDWDIGYRARAMKFGTFVICQSLYCDLTWNAPEILDTHLIRAFGKVPGTRNPGRQSIAQGQRLMEELVVDVALVDT